MKKYMPWLLLAGAGVALFMLTSGKSSTVDIAPYRTEILQRFQASGWLNDGNRYIIDSLMTPVEVALMVDYLRNQNKGFTADQLAVAKKYSWWPDRWPK